MDEQPFSPALFLFFFLTVILGKRSLTRPRLTFFCLLLRIAPTIGIFIILNCIETYQKVRAKEQTRFFVHFDYSLPQFSNSNMAGVLVHSHRLATGNCMI